MHTYAALPINIRQHSHLCSVTHQHQTTCTLMPRYSSTSDNMHTYAALPINIRQHAHLCHVIHQHQRTYTPMPRYPSTSDNIHTYATLPINIRQHTHLCCVAAPCDYRTRRNIRTGYNYGNPRDRQIIIIVNSNLNLCVAIDSVSQLMRGDVMSPLIPRHCHASSHITVTPHPSSLSRLIPHHCHASSLVTVTPHPTSLSRLIPRHCHASSHATVTSQPTPL